MRLLCSIPVSITNLSIPFHDKYVYAAVRMWNNITTNDLQHNSWITLWTCVDSAVLALVAPSHTLMKPSWIYSPASKWLCYSVSVNTVALSTATMLTKVGYISWRFSDGVIDPTFAILSKMTVCSDAFPLLHTLRGALITSAANIWTTRPKDWFTDVTVMMTWKWFLHYWPLVRGIHRMPLTKG